MVLASTPEKPVSIIACPKCQRQYKVKGDPTGKSVKCASCQHTFKAAVQKVAQSSGAGAQQAAAGVGGPMTSQPGLFPDVVPGGPDPLGNHVVQDPGFADVDVEEIKRARLAAAKKNNKLADAYSSSSSIAKMDEEAERKKATKPQNVGYLSFDTLFGFDGRINRQKYWFSSILWSLISSAVAGVLAGVYNLILGMMDIDPDPENLVAIGPFFFIALVHTILAIWVNFALMIKRYHDLGREGDRLVLLFIPIIGPLWVIFEVGFLPGQPNRNEFGPNPLAKMKKSSGPKNPYDV